MVTSRREQLHRIIDVLPETEVEAALRFLKYLRDAPLDDPVTQTLMTTPEEEDLPTPEEEAILDRALDEARRGETKPWEEVRSRIG